MLFWAMVGCGPGKVECDAAKNAAHRAWGEQSIRVGVELSQRRDELAKSEAILVVAESHAADAPPGALEATRNEVAAARAEVERLASLSLTADANRQAWRSANAAHAQDLAKSVVAGFTNANAAIAAGDAAVSACVGVE